MQHCRSVAGVLAVALSLGLAGWSSAWAQEAWAQEANASPPPATEVPFLAENAAAMNRMMADMEVKPTGDVDADFVAMMIPHHQGAIDMALAVLRYGRNEQIRRIAQEIIVEQQQEILAMRLALGQPLPPSVPAPTQIPQAENLPLAHDHSATPHMSMPMNASMSPTTQMK